MRILLIGMLVVSLIIMGCGSSGNEIAYEEFSDADLMELGAKYYQNEQYDKAIETYDYIKQNYPDTDYFVEVNIEKARALGQLERYEEQLDIIYSTLKANILPQKVPRIFTEIGHFYRNFAPYDPGLQGGGTEEDYIRALEFYNKAIEYDESNDFEAKSEAMANIGLVQAINRDYEKAAKAYQLVLNKYPESPYFYAVSQRLNNITDTSPIKIIYPEGTEQAEESGEEKAESDQPLEDAPLENQPLEDQPLEDQQMEEPPVQQEEIFPAEENQAPVEEQPAIEDETDDSNQL